ncbi:kinase-like domain-containing protein [Crucibulum laeve]|uniref:Kinase-like domain-containing protein n=1 Tax=Crucibulum laeve TaxID=68775 RepID=A0A5C3MQ70_9AGAR|nr:kinase-like domain-containing protein [Crucibulum laeve]
MSSPDHSDVSRANFPVLHSFLDLIRHGKNHNHARNEPSKPVDDYDSSSPSPSPGNARGLREQQAQAHAQIASSTKQAKTQPDPSQTAPEKSPPTREAAEMIVNEEREQKSKMPTYKGLENFKLIEKMGDGAFSNVYKALDLTTGKKVAVKVVRKYELNASQAGEKHLNREFKKKPRVTERANILKEVQIMRGTNHPSIVKLISFSESQEHYFLVLELMEGGELFHQIVKLTYFSENLARHVILQVANGIRYLHEERGVVHRDIKPENLLFERIDIIPSKNPVHRPYDEEKEDEGEFIPGVGGGGIGRVKIADFGLSKVVWNEETMTPCGTVGYTAPEIVKDERYSKSVDMWALGCVLYTLLCGFPPFYDESINVLTEKVARGYYTFLSPWWDDISHSAKDLITHLLCVDPAQRYTIDEFLAHPWCNAAPAPPPPPTPFIYGNLKEPLSGKPLDSPLLSAARGGRAHEGRSPGLATLKEAFDITYAVHRMEEEGARRRKYNGRGGAGARGFLSGLNEDDEDEEDNSDSDSDDGMVGHMTKSAGIAGVGAGGQRDGAMEGRAGPRDLGKDAAARRVAQPRTAARAGGAGRGRTGHRGFELDMDGATLLGRRHKRGGAAGVSSPLSGKPVGSPLKMEGLHVHDTNDAVGAPGQYELPAGSPMHL